MAELVKCPTCGYLFQPNLGECPNCGEIILPVEIPQEPSHQQVPAEEKQAFNTLLANARKQEQSGNPVAAIDIYKRAQTLAAKNSHLDLAMKQAAGSLQDAIYRLETTGASRGSTSTPVETTKAGGLNPRLKKTLIAFGISIPSCLLLACLGFFLQQYLAVRIPADKTSAAIEMKTVNAGKTLTAIPTNTRTPSLTPSLTFTRTPSPTPTVPTSTFTRTPTITLTPQLGSTMKSAKDGMVMHFVPAGSFIMGVNNGSNADGPRHAVTLDGFWIDETEITNAMYAKCVAENSCIPPVNVNIKGRPGYYTDPQFGDFPVVYVTWLNAMSYCSWAGRNLPTEAQWEKAARGTDERTYPWGNEFNLKWVNSGDNVMTTSKVGVFPGGKSPFGAFDMAGNVFEWVRDYYAPYEDLANNINPLQTKDTGTYVRRGGSYASTQNEIKVTSRSNGGNDTPNDSLGFRCALYSQP